MSNDRNKCSFVLLYSTSKIKYSQQNFHEMCDSYTNTVVLIKTSKGRKFGGFTHESWEGEDISKVDNRAFLFSIDKKKIYNVNKNEDAIGCHEIRGPSFGYDTRDIYIWEGCTQTNENRCETPYSYFPPKK